MTVSTETNHNEYVGNGVTTFFPYTFRIFKKSDLVVTITDGADGEDIKTLRLDTDYTVTGAGGFRGGSVVLKAPLAASVRISISRELPVTQETDLRNQGKFFAEVHEDAFDKLTMLIQQLRSVFSLALRKPSFLANYYDAMDNYIRNLRDPSRPQDAATKKYVDNQVYGSTEGWQEADRLINEKIDANQRRTLRVSDMDILSLPSAADRAEKVLTFDRSGNPQVVAPASGSAIDVLNQLGEDSGASLSGTSSGQTVQDFINSVLTSSVSEMIKIKKPTSTVLYRTKSFRGYSGAGSYCWEPSRMKSEHNGGTIIDPNAIFPTDWDNEAIVSAYFNTRNAGAGCYVLQLDGSGEINPEHFGAVGNAVIGSTSATGYDNSIVATQVDDIAYALGRIVIWRKGTFKFTKQLQRKVPHYGTESRSYLTQNTATVFVLDSAAPTLFLAASGVGSRPERGHSIKNIVFHGRPQRTHRLVDAYMYQSEISNGACYDFDVGLDLSFVILKLTDFVLSGNNKAFFPKPMPDGRPSTTLTARDVNFLNNDYGFLHQNRDLAVGENNNLLTATFVDCKFEGNRINGMRCSNRDGVFNRIWNLTLIGCWLENSGEENFDLSAADLISISSYSTKPGLPDIWPQGARRFFSSNNGHTAISTPSTRFRNLTAVTSPNTAFLSFNADLSLRSGNFPLTLSKGVDSTYLLSLPADTYAIRTPNVNVTPMHRQPLDVAVFFRTPDVLQLINNGVVNEICIRFYNRGTMTQVEPEGGFSVVLGWNDSNNLS